MPSILRRSASTASFVSSTAAWQRIDPQQPCGLGGKGQYCGLLWCLFWVHMEGNDRYMKSHFVAVSINFLYSSYPIYLKTRIFFISPTKLQSSYNSEEQFNPRVIISILDVLFHLSFSHLSHHVHSNNHREHLALRCHYISTKDN